MSGGEFAALERIRRLLSEPPPGGEVWMGDDAAVLDLPSSGGALLLATDAVVAGIHADLGLVGLDDLGWKALACALSDIAAMGGYPSRCVVSVVGPPDTDLDQLYGGLAAAGKTWGCPIVGGDLVSAPLLVVSVCVTGYLPPGRSPVLRSGARPGDQLFVTGQLGASAAGLARLRSARRPGSEDSSVQPGLPGWNLVLSHRRPSARIAEGLAAAAGGATAMIDISDGLAADLGHLVSASGVGLELDHVPVAPGASLDDALGGGEDYQLVFAAPNARVVEASFEAAKLEGPLPIGRCTADPSERRLRGEQLGGRTWEEVGWEHEWC